MYIFARYSNDINDKCGLQQRDIVIKFTELHFCQILSI